MSALKYDKLAKKQIVVDDMLKDMQRKIAASPMGICPVDLALGCLCFCQSQTCGKCVPCRIGLNRLKTLLNLVLDAEATEETLTEIESLAQTIIDTADCGIGTTSAQMVLNNLRNFREDYESHVRTGRCCAAFLGPVPCVAMCPANVDIPGYVALVNEGRSTEAVRLIRKDNPFPLACAYICEHPCESHCRRTMIDDAVNIRGIKRYAVDNAEEEQPPVPAADTGKKVAVIGGGPAGLTAAYFLRLMGHGVEVFEQRKQLGGMLRYGIPDYRLPRKRLDSEIAFILRTGIEAHCGVRIGKDISFAELKEKFDCIYVAVGAHSDSKLGIPGEDAENVISAVELLRGIGDGEMPDFRGKDVVVLGGGNVAMDCTRTSVRLGAKSVKCIYRRRITDMTALPEEIQGAMAEGAEVIDLKAPVRIETENGKACGVVLQPQLIGLYDKHGRPSPGKASMPEELVKADIVLVAIGQTIDTEGLGDEIEISKGKIKVNNRGKASDGIYAGGDCVSGPATVIKAIASGKLAASNIDAYLGFAHKISCDIDIPAASAEDTLPCGRVSIPEREAAERKFDFECVECELSTEAAMQECGRCLRCDHFGFGSFRGARRTEW